MRFVLVLVEVVREGLEIVFEAVLGLEGLEAGLDLPSWLYEVNVGQDAKCGIGMLR